MGIANVNAGISTRKKNKRINFLAPEALAVKIGNIAKKTKISESDLIRQAIIRYIEEIETKKFEKELEDGYKANYNYYLNMDREWQVADIE